MTITAQNDRILALEGIRNFRDYGGYAVAGGKRLKRGVLWRSGQHAEASDADLDTVSALGLATIIDLRGPSERESYPCRRPADFAARVLFHDGETAGLASHLDASAGVINEEQARDAMCRLYSEIGFRPTLVVMLRHYFEALRKGEGPSLVHCLAGKDRTGFAVAMVHHALGVHRDDILEDYLLTNTAGMIDRPISGGGAEKDRGKYAKLNDAARRALMGVDAQYLEAAFAALHERHGTVDAYLADVLGVDEACRGDLRGILIN